MRYLFDPIFNRFMLGYNDYCVRRIKSRFKSCGKNVFISPKCIIWSEDCLEIGDNACIHSFTHIFAGGGIVISEGAMISANCSISTISHPVECFNRNTSSCISKPIFIGKNAWIGMGAVILPGIHIGEHAIVGAGAVVTKDVPAKTIVVGNPARILRTFQIE
jgi:acetyltransferase-like isoleucine patch superfamily enzyme